MQADGVLLGDDASLVYPSLATLREVHSDISLAAHSMTIRATFVS